MKTILRSELTCPSCVRKIEKQVGLVPGVESVDVHFSTGRIVVAHDERRIPAPCSVPSRAPASRPPSHRSDGGAMHTRFSLTLFRRSERRRLLMIVSGALLLGGLLLSHFVSDVVGDAVLRDVLFIASALTAGSDIAVRAWRGLWARHISIELLVTIAAVGGIAIGIHLEAAAVTFLFLFGAYLEERTIRRTRRAIGDLLLPLQRRRFSSRTAHRGRCRDAATVSRRDRSRPSRRTRAGGRRARRALVRR
jgi:cation transport ATPase